MARSLLARPHDLTGLAAVRAVATGTRSVGEVVASSLLRAREVEGEIGAFRIIDDGAVEQKAKVLDEGVPGLLKGLLVGVKDVIDTGDLPTGYGSPLFSAHQPGEDSEVVRRLRQGGALVLGKTESTEFAMFEPTRTRNPADTERTPGGSSSGSAAAVAAGIVPVALGTQTAGSVVRPASYCGVYGLKPSKGWASTSGVWRLAGSLDTIGLLSRTVEDLRVTYQLLRSPGFRQRPRERPPTRQAALLLGADWGTTESAVETALEEAARLLSDSGWAVTEMTMPASWRHLPEVHETVMVAEVAREMHDALSDRVHLVSENARNLISEGDRTTAGEYLAALKAAEEARALLPSLAATIDVILAPSALGVAPLGISSTGDPVMCRAATLLGVPACNLKGFADQAGLPVGVQAISPAFDDLAFLEDLASIEAAVNGRR
jgi:Asp-tRNA(Asn)/Glu-tRNA(Gln) amidotransferase A subunit family amidase